MLAWEKNINALIIFIITGILLAAYGVQIFKGEQPCPLCLLQRLGMIGVASSLLLNIQFGIRMGHYGLALLSGIFGQMIALRHIAIFACPAFGSSESTTVWGLSLYTWSFIIFACSLLAIAILLFLYNPKVDFEDHRAPNAIGKAAFLFIFLISSANVITTLIQCGWDNC